MAIKLAEVDELPFLSEEIGEPELDSLPPVGAAPETSAKPLIFRFSAVFKSEANWCWNGKNRYVHKHKDFYFGSF